MQVSVALSCMGIPLHAALSSFRPTPSEMHLKFKDMTQIAEKASVATCEDIPRLQEAQQRTQEQQR